MASRQRPPGRAAASRRPGPQEPHRGPAAGPQGRAAGGTRERRDGAPGRRAWICSLRAGRRGPTHLPRASQAALQCHWRLCRRTPPPTPPRPSRLAHEPHGARASSRRTRRCRCCEFRKRKRGACPGGSRGRGPPPLPMHWRALGRPHARAFSPLMRPVGRRVTLVQQAPPPRSARTPTPTLRASLVLRLGNNDDRHRVEPAVTVKAVNVLVGA